MNIIRRLRLMIQKMNDDVTPRRTPPVTPRLLHFTVYSCRVLRYIRDQLKDAWSRNPVLLGWSTLLTAVTTCIHFSPLYRLTITGESSDLAIKILNELC
eukprot:COSAG02_NODE_2221_length_9469_cov_3.478975_5_plen_99_part_00